MPASSAAVTSAIPSGTVIVLSKPSTRRTVEIHLVVARVLLAPDVRDVPGPELRLYLADEIELAVVLRGAPDIEDLAAHRVAGGVEDDRSARAASRTWT